MAKYEKDFLLKLYGGMVRVRRFEEKAADCFTKGMLAGNIHLCIGQEASVVGLPMLPCVPRTISPLPTGATATCWERALTARR